MAINPTASASSTSMTAPPGLASPVPAPSPDSRVLNPLRMQHAPLEVGASGLTSALNSAPAPAPAPAPLPADSLAVARSEAAARVQGAVQRRRAAGRSAFLCGCSRETFADALRGMRTSLPLAAGLCGAVATVFISCSVIVNSSSLLIKSIISVGLVALLLTALVSSTALLCSLRSMEKTRAWLTFLHGRSHAAPLASASVPACGPTGGREPCSGSGCAFDWRLVLICATPKHIVLGMLLARARERKLLRVLRAVCPPPASTSSSDDALLPPPIVALGRRLVLAAVIEALAVYAWPVILVGAAFMGHGAQGVVSDAHDVLCIMAVVLNIAGFLHVACVLHGWMRLFVCKRRRSSAAPAPECAATSLELGPLPVVQRAQPHASRGRTGNDAALGGLAHGHGPLEGNMGIGMGMGASQPRLMIQNPMMQMETPGTGDRDREREREREGHQRRAVHGHHPPSTHVDHRSTSATMRLSDEAHGDGPVTAAGTAVHPSDLDGVHSMLSGLPDDVLLELAHWDLSSSSSSSSSSSATASGVSSSESSMRSIDISPSPSPHSTDSQLPSSSCSSSSRSSHAYRVAVTLNDDHGTGTGTGSGAGHGPSGRQRRRSWGFTLNEGAAPPLPLVSAELPILPNAIGVASRVSRASFSAASPSAVGTAFRSPLAGTPDVVGLVGGGGAMPPAPHVAPAHQPPHAHSHLHAHAMSTVPSPSMRALRGPGVPMAFPGFPPAHGPIGLDANAVPAGLPPLPMPMDATLPAGHGLLVNAAPNVPAAAFWPPLVRVPLAAFTSATQPSIASHHSPSASSLHPPVSASSHHDDGLSDPSLPDACDPM